MGNAESFGIIRDKQQLKALYAEEFSGSLSIDKFDTIYSPIPSYEPLTQLEEIESYCKESQHSKAWQVHQLSPCKVESFSVILNQGSIWSDFVPVIRITHEFYSSGRIEDLFEALTSPDHIKNWDDQRTSLTRVYKEDLIIEEYFVKFPFKMKKFQDLIGIKENNEGFEVSSFTYKRPDEGKPRNFFSIWKINKDKGKVLIEVIKHVDLGLRMGKDLQDLYATRFYLNFKCFVAYLQERF